MFVLTDEQRVSCRAEFRTAAGNVAKVDGVPVWSKNDPQGILNLIASGDGLTAIIAATGGVGQAQVQVVADANLGEGVREVTGVLDVEVQPAEAVSAIVVPGAPETTPVTTPAQPS